MTEQCCVREGFRDDVGDAVSVAAIDVCVLLGKARNFGSK